MIAAAITALKDKDGSSFQAIRRYIAGNYRVDIDKFEPEIKKALWTGVYGNGGCGVFKGGVQN